MSLENQWVKREKMKFWVSRCAFKPKNAIGIERWGKGWIKNCK